MIKHKYHIIPLPPHDGHLSKTATFLFTAPKVAIVERLH